MVISAAMWLQHNTVNGAPQQCWRWQSIYAAARRRSKLVVVCDMVVHLPVRATPARPGRHAVTARRVDAFISRLRGCPSAPAADRPETPNDTKDAWHDDADASSSRRRRISVLLTIDDDRTPPSRRAGVTGRR